MWWSIIRHSTISNTLARILPLKWTFLLAKKTASNNIAGRYNIIQFLFLLEILIDGELELFELHSHLPHHHIVPPSSAYILHHVATYHIITLFHHPLHAHLVAVWNVNMRCCHDMDTVILLLPSQKLSTTSCLLGRFGSKSTWFSITLATSSLLYCCKWTLSIELLNTIMVYYTDRPGVIQYTHLMLTMSLTYW